MAFADTIAANAVNAGANIFRFMSAAFTNLGRFEYWAFALNA